MFQASFSCLFNYLAHLGSASGDDKWSPRCDEEDEVDEVKVAKTRATTENLQSLDPDGDADDDDQRLRWMCSQRKD